MKRKKKESERGRQRDIRDGERRREEEEDRGRK